MLLIDNRNAKFLRAAAYVLKKAVPHQAMEDFVGLGLGLGLKAKMSKGLALFIS